MTVVDSTQAAQRGLPQGRQPIGTGAKQRILETADRLFYEDGIRSVGIDRLIAESSVTKATFYKHYGSKDRLISEYLKGRHDSAAQYIELLVDRSPDPAAFFDELLASLVAEVQRSGFRGCAFINAAAEFADPAHAVRIAVASHRDWYTGVIVDVFRNGGHPMPGDAADDVLLARDGAMTGGYAGDPVAAAAALQRGIERVLREAGLRS